MENTPIVQQNNIPALDWSNQAILQQIKQTICPDLNDKEFAAYAMLGKSTGLNPFKKEIWGLKVNGKLQVMTGINGFYAIANAHPAFDGIEVETVEDAQGKLLKCIAKVYRKDRSRPVVAEAYFEEFGKPYGTWKTMPRVMLSKCAESMALRKSFPQEMNGLYTQEEMPREFQSKLEAPSMGSTLKKPTKPVPPVKAPKKAPKRYAYDITNMPQEDVSGVLDYLEANQKVIVEQFGDVYICSKQSSKLGDYLLTEAELEEARAEYEKGE